MRSARPVSRASNSSSPGEEQQRQPPKKVATQVDDPEEVLQNCMELFQQSDLDGLLDYVSDEMIDTVLAWRKATGEPSTGVRFADVLAANAPEQLYLDTYALRNLVFNTPARLVPLSAMRVGADRYLQRCSVQSPSGEECVLTFALVLQECLQCQYRGPPLVTHKWMLRSVTGESSGEELPAHPSPSFAPEAVVQAQLQALRDGKVAPVFAHASPENKAATGPVEQFASMLSTPTYAPLLHHEGAETVQRLQPSETTYMEVVAITPRASLSPGTAGCPGGVGRAARGARAAPQRLLYMWIVSRQGDGSTWRGCWMTDAVQLVEALPLPPRR